MEYTVVIEASDAEATIWQAVTPAENVTSGVTAHELATWTATNQNVATGTNWRVRVWEGHDADPHTPLAAEFYHYQPTPVGLNISASLHHVIGPVLDPDHVRAHFLARGKYFTPVDRPDSMTFDVCHSHPNPDDCDGCYETSQYRLDLDVVTW